MTSSQQHIRALLARGESYSSIGKKLGRDGSLIRQISLGKKPGNNLTAALSELDSTGQVTHPARRRTTKRGGLAKVRGHKGEEAQTPIAPATQRVQPTAQASSQPAHLQRSVPVGRNTLRHEINRHPSGWEMHRVTVPKRVNSTNRVEGDKIIKDVVDHARGQGRRLDATVWADIVRKDGSSARIPVRLGGSGGYTAQAAFDAIENAGGALGWVGTQLSRRYPKGSYKSLTITSIDIQTWP